MKSQTRKKGRKERKREGEERKRENGIKLMPFKFCAVENKEELEVFQ